MGSAGGPGSTPWRGSAGTVSRGGGLGGAIVVAASLGALVGVPPSGDLRVNHDALRAITRSATPHDPLEK